MECAKYVEECKLEITQIFVTKKTHKLYEFNVIINYDYYICINLDKNCVIILTISSRIFLINFINIMISDFPIQKLMYNIFD